MASERWYDGGHLERRVDAYSRRIDLYRRILDIFVSAVLLVAALPVLLVTALGSAIALRAWPLFTQERVGRDGQLFRFLKIRTLPADMPSYVDKHQLDPAQIPAFCRILRRLHFDELPQLLLVLRGRMSLVGPRPEMECLHARMAPSFAALRTSVRPGCTGLWQISEACTELIGAAPEYDRTYLSRRTLRLDVWVMGRTALKMMGLGRGVTLADIPGWVGHHDHITDIITLPRSVSLADTGRPDSPRSEQLSLPLAAGR